VKKSPSLWQLVRSASPALNSNTVLHLLHVVR